VVLFIFLFISCSSKSNIAKQPLANSLLSKGNDIKKLTLPIVKEFIPVASSWKFEQCKRYFHPTLLAQVPNYKFKMIFKKFSSLGKLKSTEEPQMTGFYTQMLLTGKRCTDVTYQIPAKYENGKAEINITLVNDGNRYKVCRFTINSDLFLK
jgi:hypothetical protein